MNCPYCASPHVHANAVDIGVGSIQCGPLGCEECHAVEIGPFDDPARATEEERRIGWYAPDPELIKKAEIDDLSPDRLSPADEEEAQRLYGELCDDIAAGDDWGLNPARDR